MTDRICALIVALENDVRDDDIDALRNAIGQLRNVLSVNLVVANPGMYVAEQRVRADVREKLFDLIKAL